MSDTSHRVRRLAWRNAAVSEGERVVPAETAVALVYNGGTEAVMMATPADIADFALGFSLTEGIIDKAGDLGDIEVVEQSLGIEARMWLSAEQAERLSARRRRLAGPTGCGLCGIDSLDGAMRPVRRVDASLTLSPAEIEAALASLSPAQELGRATRAVHAAGFWTPADGLVALREDVGRHNALDKLTGALAARGTDASCGVIVLTSRVSVEMVQKSAAAGTGVIVAVSAPTALAIRLAEEAGITLIGIARDDGFEIFTHPSRIAPEPASHVAHAYA